MAVYMAKEEMKLVANNKKAYHDYFIEEKYEAGLVLHGTEVKSLRMGKCSVKEAFIRIENGEVFDEFWVIALVKEMQEAQEVIRFMKKSLNHKTELYDVSEQITFPGGRLNAGVFTGDPTAAVAAAKEWIASYQCRLDNPFLFEAGVYILTLLGEEVVIKHQ